MGGKFFLIGYPFIFQELQNSRALSVKGLKGGEQLIEYLLQNFLVHIPLSFRNLPVDAHARGSMASAGIELRLDKLCQNGDHQMMFNLAHPLAGSCLTIFAAREARA
jgi:hypothetical protein